MVKNPPAKQEKWVQSPGEGNGNPLQYSCLENPMDRGASRATVHGVTKELDMAGRLNNSNNQDIYTFPSDCFPWVIICFILKHRWRFGTNLAKEKLVIVITDRETERAGWGGRVKFERKSQVTFGKRKGTERAEPIPVISWTDPPDVPLKLV